MHFSDSIRWASGQEAPLTSKGAVGSIASSAIPELHKAAPSPPTELMVQTSPPHPRNPWPANSKAKWKGTSYKRSSLFPFQGKMLSLQHWFGAVTSYLSGSLWKSVRQGTSQTLPGWFFFFSYSAMSEARNWAKWGKLSSSDHLFCSSHYSSHCLKSNCTSAFFFFFCQGRN